MVNSAEGKQKFIFTLNDREKEDENIFIPLVNILKEK